MIRFPCKYQQMASSFNHGFNLVQVFASIHRSAHLLHPRGDALELAIAGAMRLARRVHLIKRDGTKHIRLGGTPFQQMREVSPNQLLHTKGRKIIKVITSLGSTGVHWGACPSACKDSTPCPSS